MSWGKIPQCQKLVKKDFNPQTTAYFRSIQYMRWELSILSSGSLRVKTIVWGITLHIDVIQSISCQKTLTSILTIASEYFKKGMLYKLFITKVHLIEYFYFTCVQITKKFRLQLNQCLFTKTLKQRFCLGHFRKLLFSDIFSSLLYSLYFITETSANQSNSGAKIFY